MKRFAMIAGLMFSLASLGFAGEYTGFVTDLKCAKAGKAGEGHAGCAKGCIGGGQPAALVTADGKVYEIADQDKVKEHAGQKVTISGSEADGKLSVSSVKAAD